jgi:DNA-binding response OmpR family regulator
MEMDRETIMTRGFDSYLSKPTKISELLDEIERCRPPGSAGTAGRTGN